MASKSQTLKKLNLAKSNPDLNITFSNDELISVVLTVVGAVNQIEEAVKKGRLDGKTPQAGKEYLTPKQTQDIIDRQLTEYKNNLSSTTATEFQTLKNSIEQRLSELSDGKDGEVTDEEVQKAAERAFEMLELPDFDEMLSTLVTASPETYRDGLELLPEGSKLAQEAIEGLTSDIDGLKQAIARVGQLTSGSGTIGKQQVYSFIRQAIADGTISTGGAANLGELDDVNDTAPDANQVLTWNSVSEEWEPADPPGASGGEANTASNLGTGEGVYSAKVGVDLRYKSLIGGTGVTLSSDTNEITIDRDAITKSDITDFTESDYATGAEGDLAASAVQPGDNISTLVNDAGYITAETDDQTAAEVPFTPAGNIAATDVQAAIEELDTEKGVGDFLADGSVPMTGDFNADSNAIQAVSNVFINANGKVDFGAGDVTITNGSQTLTFAGASGGYLFDGQVGVTRAGNSFFAQNTSPTTSAQVTSFSGRNGGAADNDEAYSSMMLRNSANAQEEFARLTWKALDVTDGTEDGELEEQVMVDGVMTTITKVNGGGLEVNGDITVSGTVDGVDVAGHVADTSTHGVTGAIVGTTDTQSLSNKTFTGTTTFDRVDYDQGVGTVSALGNLGATETIDWATATHFSGNLDSNITIDFSNAVSGQSITTYLSYSGAPRTIAHTPTVVWLDNSDGSAPTAPQTTGDVLIITYQNIGGVYYGSATGNYAVYA